ncbi:hypothetical protein GCM10020295_81850 [Streptomyces cinereospinus]
MYRQADVLIVPVAHMAVPARVANAPREPRDGCGRPVLALGEVTGHARAVFGLPVVRRRGRTVTAVFRQLHPLVLEFPGRLRAGKACRIGRRRPRAALTVDRRHLAMLPP